MRFGELNVMLVIVICIIFYTRVEELRQSYVRWAVTSSFCLVYGADLFGSTVSTAALMLLVKKFLACVFLNSP